MIKRNGTSYEFVVIFQQSRRGRMKILFKIKGKGKSKRREILREKGCNTVILVLVIFKYYVYIRTHRVYFFNTETCVTTLLVFFSSFKNTHTPPLRTTICKLVWKCTMISHGNRCNRNSTIDHTATLI